MYHHAKRPTPALWCAAGGVFAVGVVSLVARGLDNFTNFTLVEPFDTLSFVLAIGCTSGGPTLAAWLRGLTQKRRIAELQDDNRRLHEQCDRLIELKEAIRHCDEQAEVNTVLTRKVLKALDDDNRANEVTQPIARLHSIEGGGGA